MASVKLYPSTISTVLEWTTPDNAKADDGVYATTVGTRDLNHDLIGTNFDISSIPPGSIINDITLEVKYKVSNDRAIWTGTLAPFRNGAIDNTKALTTSNAPESDTIWQNTNTGSWTLEDLELDGILFRVRREQLISRTFSVDYLAIIVDYTAAGYSFSGSGAVSSIGSTTGLATKATTKAASVSATGAVTGTGVKAEYTYDFTGTGVITASTNTSGTGTKQTQAQGTATSTATVTSFASRQATSQGLPTSTHSLTVSGTKQASGAGANTSGQAVTSSYSLAIPTYDFSGTGAVTAQGIVNSASAKQSSRTGTLTASTSLSGISNKQAIHAGLVTSQTNNIASYTLDIPTYDFSGQGAITANGITQASATKYSTSASAITHTTTIVSTASIERYSTGFITALAIATGNYTRSIIYKVKSKHMGTYVQGDVREVVMLPASFTVRATLSEGKSFTKRIGEKTREVITW